jgi:hypothetical protein
MAPGVCSCGRFRKLATQMFLWRMWQTMLKEALYIIGHSICTCNGGTSGIIGFEELGREESGMSEETCMAVVEAAQTMRTVESGMGHTLSE